MGKYKLLNPNGGVKKSTRTKRAVRCISSTVGLSYEKRPERRENVRATILSFTARPTRRKSRISGSVRPNPDMRTGVGSDRKEFIVTHRFDNSRLTCVCRSKMA